MNVKPQLTLRPPKYLSSYLPSLCICTLKENNMIWCQVFSTHAICIILRAQAEACMDSEIIQDPGVTFCCLPCSRISIAPHISGKHALRIAIFRENDEAIKWILTQPQGGILLFQELVVDGKVNPAALILLKLLTPKQARLLLLEVDQAHLDEPNTFLVQVKAAAISAGISTEPFDEFLRTSDQVPLQLPTAPQNPIIVPKKWSKGPIENKVRLQDSTKILSFVRAQDVIPADQAHRYDHVRFALYDMAQSVFGRDQEEKVILLFHFVNQA